MDWRFPLILIAALVLSGLLSTWQMRRYTRGIKRLARQHTGPGMYLVSGRHRGWARGAIVALVVDTTSWDVVAAETVAGVSSFAGLRPAPALMGPVNGVAGRARGKAVTKAVTDALTRLPGAPAPTPAATKQALFTTLKRKASISR
jgi:DNA-binding transcriptional regulator of glucitol operon